MTCYFKAKSVFFDETQYWKVVPEELPYPCYFYSPFLKRWQNSMVTVNSLMQDYKAVPVHESEFNKFLMVEELLK